MYAMNTGTKLEREQVQKKWAYEKQKEKVKYTTCFVTHVHIEYNQCVL